MEVLSIILVGGFLLGLTLMLIYFGKFFWDMLRDAITDRNYMECILSLGILLALPTMLILNIGLFYKLFNV